MTACMESVHASEDALPLWITPYKGLAGLPRELSRRYPDINALVTKGIDRYQANHFLVYRPETAAYLYGEYTPLEVNYLKGTFPDLEKWSEEIVCKGGEVVQRVEGILSFLRQHLRHPLIPPAGRDIACDRNLNEEDLLRSGCAWCNEQARVCIRLCQIQGIPARMVHLFYANAPKGHTLVEFYDGRGWVLADASYFLIYRRKDGSFLSAADCHDRGEGQQRYGEIMYAKVSALFSLGKSAGVDADRYTEWKTEHSESSAESYAAQLHSFGIINYPLNR